MTFEMFLHAIFLTDSYKFSHWRQYPKGTEYVFSYLESRGGESEYTTPFGLQYLLKRYLSKPITKADIDMVAEYAKLHFGNDAAFNREGWNYIVDKHGGYLPVSIKAVPEGTPVPNKNVLMTVVNTDPKCFWLTNYLETLLVQTWYPTTVATKSREMKKIINKWLLKTGNPAEIDFKLHDFGFRGVSSVESAAVGGAAHLLNFKGTDTFIALPFARQYYGADMAGFSIPAAEHSTITSWGRNGEYNAFRNMLEQYPTGLVAVVSDSYDIYNACKNIWGQQLKSMVMEREGTLVIRPDSGTPHEVVPKVLDTLGEYFDTTTNEKGYKVLDKHVRMIQGDGIDSESTEKILGAMAERGWSADNIAFGMGGALLQKMDRDTQKFAFKCSAVRVGSDWFDVYKRPVDAPWKTSKKGRLKLVKNKDCGYITKSVDQPGDDQLVEIFRDGKLLKDYTFEEIRERAKL